MGSLNVVTVYRKGNISTFYTDFETLLVKVSRFSNRWITFGDINLPDRRDGKTGLALKFIKLINKYKLGYVKV
jgi:hypothetical protein